MSHNLIKKVLLLALVSAVLFTPSVNALNPALRIGISASRVASFSPFDVPGLAAWHDASDASTITLNGSNVSAWADKSGNGMTISQSSASEQPAYVTGSRNGKNVVRVTASKYMHGDETGAKNIFRNIEYVAIFTVIHPTDINTLGRLYAFTRAQSIFVSNVYITYGKRVDSDSSLTTADNANISANATQIILSQWNCTDRTIRTQINNTTEIVKVNGLTSGKFDNTATVLGRVINYSTTGGAAGDFCEQLIYKRSTALSADEIALIKTYLNTKWACY